MRHVIKVAAHFQKKNKMFVYSFKYPSKESGKMLRNEAAEPYLEPCQISMMERFCENTNAKSFMINVWYGCKHTPEVVQDSKINLKWINTKILEKTVHFFSVDVTEDTDKLGYPKISEATVRTCVTT